MDTLDLKAEKFYTFILPQAPLQDGRPAQKSFSRGARILLFAVAATVTVGLHVFKYRIYHSDYPEVFVHPAPVTMSIELTRTKEFDWESVSRP